MKHDDDKTFIEEFAKEVLEEKQLLKDLVKSESPDYIVKDKRIGVEVTKVFANSKLDGYTKKYGHNIKNINKYNIGYEKLGGKVLRKNSVLAKILKLKNSPYHKDYIHIQTGYNDNDFNDINKAIIKKLERLNNKYRTRNDIDNFQLAIVTPMHFTQDNITKEVQEIENIQKNYEYKYEYIYIIIINKQVIVFNTEDNSYKTV